MTRRFDAALGRLLLVAVLACAVVLACTALAAGKFDRRGREVLSLQDQGKAVAYPGGGFVLAASLVGERLPSGEASGLAKIKADGSFDRSFGGDGFVPANLEDFAVQHDGKIIVAGEAGTSQEQPEEGGRLPPEEPTVTRLLPSGAPDPSFGRGGSRAIDFGGPIADRATAIAAGGGGSILLGGYQQTSQDSRGEYTSTGVLARLRADGSLDRSFGKGGLRIIPGLSGFYWLRVVARGAIMAMPQGPSLWQEIIRLKRDGSLDRSFGNEGAIGFRGLSGEGDVFPITDLAVLPGGKLVVAAGVSAVGGDELEYTALVARFTKAGRLDRSFGEGGIARARFSGWFFADSFAVQRNGRSVVVGAAQSPDHTESDLAAISFTPDGKLDRRFGKAGKVSADFGGWELGDAVVFQNRGRVVLIGDTQSPEGGPTQTVIARFGAARRR